MAQALRSSALISPVEVIADSEGTATGFFTRDKIAEMFSQPIAEDTVRRTEWNPTENTCNTGAFSKHSRYLPVTHLRQIPMDDPTMATHRWIYHPQTLYKPEPTPSLHGHLPNPAPPPSNNQRGRLQQTQNHSYPSASMDTSTACSGAKSRGNPPLQQILNVLGNRLYNRYKNSLRPVFLQLQTYPPNITPTYNPKSAPVFDWNGSTTTSPTDWAMPPPHNRMVGASHHSVGVQDRGGIDKTILVGTGIGALLLLMMGIGAWIFYLP